jgi:hypothetical protein
VTECKQSRGKDGPNLEDPRKAMIEQIHFQTQGIGNKQRQSEDLKSAMRKMYNFGAQMSATVPDR